LAIELLSIVAVLGCLFINAASVEATCGDYLAHDSVVQRRLSSRDVSAKDIASHSPTHTPSCRQAPIEKPLSTPVVSVPPQDRWALIITSLVPAPNRVSFVARADDPAASPTITFRLYRPPKDGSLSR